MLPVSHEECPVTSSCVRHHGFVLDAYITRPRRGKQGGLHEELLWARCSSRFVTRIRRHIHQT